MKGLITGKTVRRKTLGRLYLGSKQRGPQQLLLLGERIEIEIHTEREREREREKKRERSVRRRSKRSEGQ